MKNDNDNIIMSYFHALLMVAANISTKAANIFSCFQGWVAAAILAIGNFILGYELSLIAVMVCFLSDAVWGIVAARKRKKYSRSGLARHTLIKGACYMNILVIFIFVDKILPESVAITTVIMATVICLVEMWSIAGNILIIDPNIPVLRLLRRELRGEIAHKLGCDEEAVDEELGKLNTQK